MIVYGSEYVTMSDGVRLYTAMAVPEKAGKFPVIFMRTPYAQAPDANYPEKIFSGFPFIDAGYAIVFQHCRGTGGSDGVMISYINERRDGLETLEWLRKQFFYNGEIYLNGGSYSASVHFMYLDTKPSDIKGAVFTVQDCNRYNIVYKNGFFKHSLHTRHFVGLYRKTLGLPDGEKFDYLKYCAIRPQTEIIQHLFGHDVPSYTGMLSHSRADDIYWRSAPGIGDGYNAVRYADIPMLFIGGWYDIYVKGMLEMWNSLKPETMAKSALIMGPWDHAGKVKPEWNFACPFAEAAEDRNKLALSWFNHIHYGTDLYFAEKGKVKYYVMGGGEWRVAARMPEDGVPEEYFLAPSGSLEKQPCVGGELSFEFDPENPAEFSCGAHGFADNISGFGKQDKPDFRPDVASFISREIDCGVTLDGAVTVILDVRSNCSDTAFFVRLCAVKGKDAWVIADSITSLCYELGNYIPGTNVLISFKLDPVPWHFDKGDCLRLDISSSNYPTFSVHTNTKGNWAEQTATRKAVNTVVYGRSRLLLPLGQ